MGILDAAPRLVGNDQALRRGLLDRSCGKRLELVAVAPFWPGVDRYHPNIAIAALRTAGTNVARAVDQVFVAQQNNLTGLQHLLEERLLPADCEQGRLSLPVRSN